MRPYKRSLQLGICIEDVKRSILIIANKYLFANLLIFISAYSDEAKPPSFAVLYVAIEASSTSLEVLIASSLPPGGTAQEATAPMAIKLLIANGLLLLAPMASGQSCYLTHQLVLTMRFCKCAFVA